MFFTNKTTLADHYKLLGDVLNEIRKDDETKWVWNKVRIELNDLARKIERDLGENNVEGVGLSAIVDDYWSCYWSCWAQCMAQEYTPIPGVPPSGGICDICWPLLETCLMFLPITWEACILAAGCFGLESAQCGWSCGQQCS